MNAEKRHITAWLLMPFLAVLNGVVRDATYGQAMGHDLAHSVSVIPLLVLIITWGAVFARRWPLPDTAAAVRVGAVWLVLTLAFEFGLGALRGVPVATMLGEYDVTSGKVWPLIPLATLFTPVLMRHWTGRRA